MNRLEPPISPGDRGPRIADLHAALQAMADHGYLDVLAFTAEAQDAIHRGLPAESGTASYGPAAQLFVARLQEFIGAGDASAVVDARTAEFINRVLAEWGLIDAGREPFLVSGVVIGGDASQRVVAYDEDMRSPRRLDDGPVEHQAGPLHAPGQAPRLPRKPVRLCRTMRPGHHPDQRRDRRRPRTLA